MTIDRIPHGVRVFVDSTVFVYHATATSGQCTSLLQRCESGDLSGVTSVLVLAEVAHRLMAMEAAATGLLQGKNLVKKLRQQPELVRKLHLHADAVERIPLMGIEVLPVDVGTLLRSAAIRRQYGLLVNDSLAVASALDEGVEHLASADADLARVSDLKVYRPNDLRP